MSHSNADEPSANVELIREAFHYQSRFHNSTVVFKIDFPVTEHPLFPSIVKDLALLANTGFRVVIVPGAKEWISEILAQYAIPSSYKGSRRITTAQAMPFVQMAAFHSATAFMTGFSASRVDAVTGNFVRARGIGVIDGTDMEHTGAVDKIYTESLQRILELGMVPLLPCIGWSSSGKPYNVPSSEIAFSAATRLGAVKLVLVSLSEGIKKDSYDIPDDIATTECGRITRLTPQQAQQVLDANARKGADDKALADLALAVRACKAGVERVHIINGDEEGAILKELF
ncbi:MAG: amino-acid N-acetyltransferase, partial [Treponema sp.]|nr:amino-acid N-acetyltransferase [Treponema sp.]